MSALGETGKRSVCARFSVPDFRSPISQRAFVQHQFGRVHRKGESSVKPTDTKTVQEFLIQLLLWELVLADVAEAEFIEAAVSELMKFIHHVVMTTLKGSINTGRLQDH
jgi:hypothetical protein